MEDDETGMEPEVALISTASSDAIIEACGNDAEPAAAPPLPPPLLPPLLLLPPPLPPPPPLLPSLNTPLNIAGRAPVAYSPE
jgi:hypothetical protein